MADSPRPVALVTGAARGIGAATVDAFVAAGWRVAALDACRDDPALGYDLATPGDLDAVVEAHTDRVVPVIADVRDSRALDDAVHRVVGHFGRLDAAVACAGVIAGGAPAWETDDAVWATLLDVNMTGVWRLATATIPSMLATDPLEGRHRAFVAVSSAAGVRSRELLAAYSASKHGVIGLVTAMAAELGPHEVTANVVCPGSTRTPLLAESARIYGLDDPAGFTRHHLLDRLIEPAEVADAIVHLCSPGAGAITGAVIPVDAGMGIR